MALIGHDRPCHPAGPPHASVAEKHGARRGALMRYQVSLQPPHARGWRHARAPRQGPRSQRARRRRRVQCVPRGAGRWPRPKASRRSRRDSLQWYPNRCNIIGRHHQCDSQALTVECQHKALNAPGRQVRCNQHGNDPFRVQEVVDGISALQCRKFAVECCNSAPPSLLVKPHRQPLRHGLASRKHHGLAMTSSGSSGHPR